MWNGSQASLYTCKPGELSPSSSRLIKSFSGSVKSNIGHLEGGSGIASLIKAILALERGIIPPNANFEMSNPRIDTKELNIAVGAFEHLIMIVY